MVHNPFFFPLLLLVAFSPLLLCLFFPLSPFPATRSSVPLLFQTSKAGAWRKLLQSAQIPPRDRQKEVSEEDEEREEGGGQKKRGERIDE